jgi:hypothetical protein
MRAQCSIKLVGVVVAMAALTSGCTPHEPPKEAAVVPATPEPEQAPIGAVRQVQSEEWCRELVSLRTQLQIALTRYNDQHPEAVRIRRRISELSFRLPADGTFCPPNGDVNQVQSDQEQGEVIQVRSGQAQGEINEVRTGEVKQEVRTR